ncbi:hypothetical protein E2C01_039370 [Portunus trituberculatus]|uniref:Uncharacterized protein n=1 Tax=Portunus trituberculatus TaxID=210409 RepID=A0A5B7FMV5_PORTR|nr:hypothetical protein [Portunus trituberculatus]
MECHIPVASRLLQYGHPSCQIIVDFGKLGFEKWRRSIHNGVDERLNRSERLRRIQCRSKLARGESHFG